MNYKIRFVVDEKHCSDAEMELAAMLLRQERNFSERWHSRSSTKIVVRMLQVIGIVLALIGEALTIGSMWLDTRARTPRNAFFAFVFIIFLVTLILVPRISFAIRRWSAQRAQQRAPKRARRFLKIARKLAPFEAEYDIKGDLLTYARGKDDNWNFAWHRKLRSYRERGVAMRAQHVTAIFRRSTSFIPAIIVLHSDDSWLRTALDEIGIRSVDIDREFAEPLGEVGLNSVAAK